MQPGLEDALHLGALPGSREEESSAWAGGEGVPEEVSAQRCDGCLRLGPVLEEEWEGGKPCVRGPEAAFGHVWV